MRNLLLVLFFWSCFSCSEPGIMHPMVFQSDFGVRDGAVSSMKGVAMKVDSRLVLHDLTHEIPPYNIWEAAYRLDQTAVYWPAGTVFVSVVDPGVGTSRRSIVLLTKTGHFFISPDNGTLGQVAKSLGIAQVRVINEAQNRMQGSEKAYTFHGRDIFAFVGARLAAGKMRFEQVGERIEDAVVHLDIPVPKLENDTITGIIPVLDVQYGNIWTNISDSLVNLHFGDPDSIQVSIQKSGKVFYEGKVPYVNTFGAVFPEQPLAYSNSQLNFSLAINQGSFAETYGIKSGLNWQIRLWK